MSEENQKEEQAPEFSKVAIGLIIAVVVLGGVVYAGYKYSQRQPGKVTLPSGYPATSAKEIDCSKPRPNEANLWDYYTKCDEFKVDQNTKWITFKNAAYKFEFDIPETAQTEVYPNGMGLNYKEIGANWNLVYSVDLASSRSGEFKNLKGKAYVENYWRQYPGLAGVKSVEPIVNGKGVDGWKAIYKIGDKDGNQEIFFELGKDSGNFVHFTKGIFSQQVFDNIVGTFKITGTATEEETATPTAKE